MAHDPKRIIDTADAFLLAGERAMEQRPVGVNRFQMLLVPGVVSNAFAAELYFKALLMLEGGPASGHDLASLFAKLKDETRKVVREQIGLAETDFDDGLGKVAKAFVEWRYIYEAGSIGVNFEFLRNLAHAAGDVARKRLAGTVA